MLIALAAGVVAGRLARGAKEAQGSSGSPQVGSPTPAGLLDATSTAALPTAGTATADPLSGVDSPQQTPQYPDGSNSSATQWGTP